jgi:hypothetical protein
MKNLSQYDKTYLESIGIEAEPPRFTDKRFLESVGIAADLEPVPAPNEIDETCKMLLAAGVPVTAANWMNLQFAGHPPAIGKVEGEVLSMFPRWVRAAYDPGFEPDEDDDPCFELDGDDICNAPSAGWCGEPSHTPKNATLESDEAADDEDN